MKKNKIKKIGSNKENTGSFLFHIMLPSLTAETPTEQ